MNILQKRRGLSSYNVLFSNEVEQRKLLEKLVRQYCTHIEKGGWYSAIKIADEIIILLRSIYQNSEKKMIEINNVNNEIPSAILIEKEKMEESIEFLSELFQMNKMLVEENAPLKIKKKGSFEKYIASRETYFRSEEMYSLAKSLYRNGHNYAAYDRAEMCNSLIKNAFETARKSLWPYNFERFSKMMLKAKKILDEYYNYSYDQVFEHIKPADTIEVQFDKELFDFYKRKKDLSHNKFMKKYGNRFEISIPEEMVKNPEPFFIFQIEDCDISSKATIETNLIKEYLNTLEEREKNINGIDRIIAVKEIENHEKDPDEQNDIIANTNEEDYIKICEDGGNERHNYNLSDEHKGLVNIFINSCKSLNLEIPYIFFPYIKEEKDTIMGLIQDIFNLFIRYNKSRRVLKDNSKRASAWIFIIIKIKTFNEETPIFIKENLLENFRTNFYFYNEMRYNEKYRSIFYPTDYLKGFINKNSYSFLDYNASFDNAHDVATYIIKRYHYMLKKRQWKTKWGAEPALFVGKYIVNLKFYRNHIDNIIALSQQLNIKMNEIGRIG